jgi:hypothetical protein
MRLASLAAALLFASPVFAQTPPAQTKPQGNPLFTHVFAADPSAHIWPGDDRLWLYTSNDVPGTNTHATMDGYHVFSTRDLLNWTDHGRVLHLDQVPWAISHMWAIDAILWKGTYYLVYCAKERETGMFRTGLATSDRPEGPFTDIGFIQGVNWGQDPAIIVGDDGHPYLFWGAGGGCEAVRLTEDLRAAIPETKVKLSQQLPEFFEGPWIHRFNGKYVLSYPGLPEGKWPQHMYYAFADQPLGPYTYQGKYMAGFPGMSGTNHGSIIQYQGNWIFFYHGARGPGAGGQSRTLMADFINPDADGKLPLITPTDAGITGGRPARVTFLLEAENGPAAGGRIDSAAVASTLPGYSGRGYITGFDRKHGFVEVLALTGNPGQYRLSVRYQSPTDAKANLRVNAHERKDVAFPRSDAFTTLDLGLVTLAVGENRLRIINEAARLPDLAIDAFVLEHQP